MGLHDWTELTALNWAYHTEMSFYKLQCAYYNKMSL